MRQKFFIDGFHASTRPVAKFSSITGDYPAKTLPEILKESFYQGDCRAMLIRLSSIEFRRVDRNELDVLQQRQASAKSVIKYKNKCLERTGRNRYRCAVQ